MMMTRWACVACIVFALVLSAPSPMALGASQGNNQTLHETDTLLGAAKPASSVATPSTGLNCSSNTDPSPLRTVSLLDGTTQSGAPTSTTNLLEPTYVTGGPVPGSIYVTGRLTGNLELLNFSSGATLFDTSGFGQPDAIAFDAADQRVFVADYSKDTLSVVGAANGSVLTTLSAGLQPDALAYDAGTDRLFVANYNSPSLSVINTRSDTFVANVTIGLGANSLALDSANSTLYVGMDDYVTGGNVTLVNATNASVITSIPMPAQPAGLAIDTSSLSLYVSAALGRVYVMDLANYSIEGNYSVTGAPRAIAVSAGTNQLLVADATGDTLELLNESNPLQSVEVAVGALPGDIFVEAGADTAFVSNSGGANITALNLSTTLTRSLRLGVQPSALAVNETSGATFIADLASSSLFETSESGSVLSSYIPAGAGPATLAFDSPAGLVLAGDRGYIGLGGDNLSIISTPTFQLAQQLLLPGEPGPIAIDPHRDEALVATGLYGFNEVEIISLETFTKIGSLPGGLGVGAIAIDPNGSDLYVALANNEVVDYNLSTDDAVGSVEVGYAPSAIVFDSALGDLLVSNSGANSVQEINVSSFAVTATLGVGLQPMGLTLDAGNGLLYIANDGSPNITALNLTTFATTSIPTGFPSSAIEYDPQSDCLIALQPLAGTAEILPSVGSYSLSVEEQGLPSDWDWGIASASEMSNSTAMAIILFLTNGTYTFGAWAAPPYQAANSSLTVTVDGKDQFVLVSFGVAPPPTFQVTFQASRLPDGANWSVVLNGTHSQSQSTAIAFEEPNGSYPFAVSPPSGFDASPLTGVVTVQGRDVAESVVFSPVEPPLYTVTFTQAGLPEGLDWWVNVNLRLAASNSTEAAVELVNGTYTYSVGTAAAYTAQPANGSLHVSGDDVRVVLTFHPIGEPQVASSTARWTDWILVGVSGLIVLAVALLYYQRLSRRHE